MLFVLQTLASWRFWLAVYALFALGVSVWLCSIRPSVLKRLEQPELQSSWNAWRAEAAKSSGKDGQPVVGPVQRRVPKSMVPPLSVLLGDHFPAVWGSLLFFPALPFAFVAMVARGIAREAIAGRGTQSSTSASSRSDDSPGSAGSAV